MLITVLYLAFNIEIYCRIYKTIKHNNLIVGDHTRHPSTLSSSEIEKIYNAEFEDNDQTAADDYLDYIAEQW